MNLWYMGNGYNNNYDNRIIKSYSCKNNYMKNICLYRMSQVVGRKNNYK